MATPAVLAEFQALGLKFGWDPVVTAWVTDPAGLGATAIADFTFCAAAEVEVAALVDSVTGVVNRLQQKSRVRQAWSALRKAVADADSLKRKRADDADLDLPLEKADLDSLADLFWGRYHIVLPPHLSPADLLISRLHRELATRLLSLKDVWKVRSQRHQVKQASKRTELGHKTTLITDEPEEIFVTRDLQTYMQQLYTLCVAYSMAGVSKLASAPATEPRGHSTVLMVQCPLDIMLRYYWRANERASMVAPARQLAWLCLRDEEERTQWVDMYRHGTMELGAVVETILNRRESCWEVRDEDLPGHGRHSGATPVKASSATVTPPPAPSHHPTAAMSTAATLRDGTEVCGRYNKVEGCKDKSCKRKHVCNRVQKGGRTCGGRHPAHRCANKKAGN
jgi:hypothetical protein